ncbi:MAG: DAK2 domain-containing protein [Erysipelotrichaceae bacterium]|nr:DAK2 domain-containing protein [Erysipelotrichaceae bacterium]
MEILDCRQFKEMIISGANNLANNAERVNKLNVFPVPDGDTGTNMNMTMASAAEETAKFMNDYIGDTCKFLSKNMLMNARGNSGVILSQVFKGIAKALTGAQSANVQQLSEAFMSGSKAAYKAIMKPVEGTILTVVRESAEMGEYLVKKNPKCSIEDYMTYMVVEANESLKRTPELLEVLKEAGVLDSGATGYCCILEGFNSYLQGKPVAKADQQTAAEAVEEGYCVEIKVNLNEQYKKEFVINRLETSLGRSCNNIKLARENDCVKLHLHTERPGDIINTLQRFGELDMVRVEMLSKGHNPTLSFESASAERKNCAVITVCNADGIARKFKDLTVDYIVFGGQTMNPSTQDFVNAIKEANAENIIILPNNSNIILAAKQAKQLCKNCHVEVIESKSVIEGINACLNYSCEAPIDDNIKAMTQAVREIRTISITQAVKATTMNGLIIRKNNYIGLVDKDLVATGKSMEKTLYATIDQAAEKQEISYLTVIYGKEITKAQAQAVLDYAAEKYDAEGELIAGQQDLYPFIIGIE